MVFTICVIFACILVGCILLKTTGFYYELSNGTSLIRVIVVTSIMIACVVLPIGVVVDWFNNKSKQQVSHFTQFLSDYDPVLKARRDEVIRVIREINGKRDELEKAKNNYKSKEAIDRIDMTIRQIKTELIKMDTDLKAMDAKIELAMAAKDIQKADRGGLKSEEADELLRSASLILRQANELQQLVENDGESPLSPPKDEPPRKPKSVEDGIVDLQNNKTDTSSDSVGNPSSLIAAPTDPKIKALSDEVDEMEKIADKAAKALETIRKNEAAQAQVPKSSTSQKASPAIPKPKPAVDREAIQKEIRRLDASIANNEENLNQAWARIENITHNGTAPIVKDSRQHVEYQQAHRVLQDCEAQLPDLKNRREVLNAQIEGK